MMIDGNRACSAPDAGFGYPDDPSHVQSLIVTPGGNAIVFVPEATHLEHCVGGSSKTRFPRSPSRVW